MSEILKLASDFIDRMSNPAYGIRTNEEYSLRFADLLASEGFAALLRHEAERTSDIDALTPHGWLWFLGWARSQDVTVNDDLLLQLTERWSSVFIQASAIDVATQKVDWERRNYPLPLGEFGQPFLRELLRRSTTLPEVEISEDEEPEAGFREEEDISTGRAENTLVALLQIGRDVTLDAAASLLHHPWRGQPKLLDFYRFLREGLDEETQEVWDARLGRPDQERFRPRF